MHYKQSNILIDFLFCQPLRHIEETEKIYEKANSSCGSKDNEVLKVSSFEMLNSDDNDVIVSIRKRVRILVIEDESGEKENITPTWSES